MKNILRILTIGVLSSLLPGCVDFEEVNRNPFAVDEFSAKPYSALNQSIIYSHQNPDTAERLFVINWASAARQDGEDGYGTSVGNLRDAYMQAAYNHMCYSMTYCQNAITLVDVQLEGGDLTDHEFEFYPNLKAFARIWMVYLMSEFCDTFGPMPIDGFKGVNPEFCSVKDVYYYMYDELEEAIAAINTGVSPNTDEAQCDPIYSYDASNWKKFGISMWMRLAMRLSVVDPAKAKEEFEAAVAAGEGITAVAETFQIKEGSGNTWNNLTAVMSRTWDIQSVSATYANLTTNLGVASEQVIKDDIGVLYSSSGNTTELQDARLAKIKDETYFGMKFEDHWSENTDNPTKQFFFDGIPAHIDPRAFVYFFLPGDYTYRRLGGYDSYFTSSSAPQKELMYESVGGIKTAVTDTIDASYCWNGLTAGIWYDDDATNNGLVNGNGNYGYVGTYPALSDEARSGEESYRVYFGPWETYFLLAEAALYGWNTGGVSDQTAYETGISRSFEYAGVSTYLTEYLASEHYNRVGTSVKWDHTNDPQDVAGTYVDGYTGETLTMTYEFPDASKTLYAKVADTPALNDHLTKIITQKYIANTPWLPLENLSDHRRLGLPFWEIPVSTTLLSYMPDWTLDSWKGTQKPGYFVQRFSYPSTLENADPTGYAYAVELLGGEDNAVTPLWWAIKE